jgi:hypothetical protein
MEVRIAASANRDSRSATTGALGTRGERNLEQSFTGPWRARWRSCHRDRRPDVHVRRGRRQAADLRHRVRRRPRAVRGAVPDLAVLRSGCRPTAPHRPVTMRPVVKALHRPLTILRGRPALVLPRPDGRSRDVQPVLLAPRRPAGDGGPLHGGAPVGDVAGPAMLAILLASSVHAVATTSASTHPSPWRSADAIAAAHRARLPRSRRGERAACGLGLRGRRHVPHEGRACGRGLPPWAAISTCRRPDACATPAVTHRMEAALKLLDERLRVYQYLVKRTRRPVRSGPVPHAGGAEALTRRTVTLNGPASRRCTTFASTSCCCTSRRPLPLGTVAARRHGGRRSERALSVDEVGDAILEAEVERASRRCTTGRRPGGAARPKSARAPERSDGPSGSCAARQLRRRRVRGAPQRRTDPLDYFVADSPVECHRDHLRVGGSAVKVLSMKEPPAQTFAHMLADL